MTRLHSDVKYLGIFTAIPQQSSIELLEQFASTVTPVQVLQLVEGQLPTAGQVEGNIAVCVNDGLLYRFHNGSWTNLTPTTTLGGKISYGQIDAGAVRSDEIYANSITGGKLAAGAIDGQIITGAYIRTAASGVRITIDGTDGIKTYNAGGVSLFQVAVDGAVTLKTAASGGGKRTEIGSTGILGYDSGNNLVWGTDIDGRLYTTDLVFKAGANYVNIQAAAGTLYFGTSLVPSLDLIMGSDPLLLYANGHGFAYGSIELRTYQTGQYILFTRAGTEMGRFNSAGLSVTGDITVSGNVDGVDVAALSSSVSSHTGASSGVHGATGSVVGTTDAQTLTNKIIDSNAQGKGVKVRHFSAAPTWANEAQGVFTTDISSVRRIGFYDGSNNFSIVLPDVNAV